MKTMERTATDWEKILTNFTSNRGLVSTIIKNSQEPRKTKIHHKKVKHRGNCRALKGFYMI